MDGFTLRIGLVRAWKLRKIQPLVASPPQQNIYVIGPDCIPKIVSGFAKLIVDVGDFNLKQTSSLAVIDRVSCKTCLARCVVVMLSVKFVVAKNESETNTRVAVLSGYIIESLFDN